LSGYSRNVLTFRSKLSVFRKTTALLRVKRGTVEQPRSKDGEKLETYQGKLGHVASGKGTSVPAGGRPL